MLRLLALSLLAFFTLAACDGPAPADDAGRADAGPPALPPPGERDSDDDTILDVDEGQGDFDGDGTPNYLDLDSDEDLVPDRDEAGDARLDTPPVSSNGAGMPDFLNVDVDGDAILDGHEFGVDTDGDGVFDQLDQDSDGDGFTDAEEAGDDDVFTLPADTDGDAIPDFRDPDSDNDGLDDFLEHALGTDPARGDTDGDGVSDSIEVRGLTDPRDPMDSPGAGGERQAAFLLRYREAPDPAEVVLRFTLTADELPAPHDLSASYVASAMHDYLASWEATPGAAGCTATLEAVDVDGDGQAETLRGASVGDVACWTVRARGNDDQASPPGDLAQGLGELRVETGASAPLVGVVAYTVFGCPQPCAP